jgi:hypothetical protein
MSGGHEHTQSGLEFGVRFTFSVLQRTRIERTLKTISGAVAPAQSIRGPDIAKEQKRPALKRNA